MLRNHVMSLFVVAALMSAAHPAVAAKIKAVNAKQSGTTVTTAIENKDSDIRAALISLEDAFASKNLEKAIGQFAENAIFVDQAGEQTAGRLALQARLEPLFKQSSAIPLMGFQPESIRFPAPGVASVVGIVSRKQGTISLPTTRFTMLMVRQNDAWRISDITETAIQSSRAEDRLADLDWLIGEWRVDKKDVAAQMKVEWAPGRKFILAKTTITKPDKSEQVDTQVIGWDPRNNRIISWHFDSNGGYGTGVWSANAEQNKWNVDVSGTGADGSLTTATNVFTFKKSGEFSWQSVNRSLDDAPVPDTEALMVQRISTAR